jgi:sucrose phosphorylase
MQNKVQLITYVDRLSNGGFADLEALLTGRLGELFGAVHVLPFFDPIDGADAGFDPIDHTRVDPRLGDWASVKSLSKHVDVMGDVIVNHVSSDSPQFKDFSEKGSASKYADLFLTLDRVFPNGVTEQDLSRIYRPRPGLPFTPMTFANGERRVLWTTFTPKQIDIDVKTTAGRDYLDGILETFAKNGIRMVRLDAIGYAIKTPGTSCFMTAETFEFIDGFTARARNLGIEVLVEIHSYYRRQIEVAARVDWVYDFALPPLVLHAFAFRTAALLQEWIRIRPPNSLTVLDTHDGIGVIDIGADPAAPASNPGLVTPQEIDGLVESIHANSNGESRLATGAAASNLDLYQVNCTFYDALGRSDRAYLAARAIQFFLPGIPQIYYVGLLAGRNDLELLGRTAVGRDINRHYFSSEEIDAALQSPVVADLLDLIRLRNAHPAFAGAFSDETVVPTRLKLAWVAGSDRAELAVDFEAGDFSVSRTVDGVLREQTWRTKAPIRDDRGAAA